MYHNCDYALFEALNFDGGPLMDKIMVTLSGTWMWIPLYLLILWLVYRKVGWRNTFFFLFMMVAAIALSDMICGIFKSNGLLGGLLPDFTPRLRPMYTEELQQTIHIVKFGGKYGTVSAHAATIASVAVFSASVIRRWWFTLLVVVSTLLICYSRIYLAYHFPIDLAWGLCVGILTGGIMATVFHKLKR
ncbi:MAG: phosphatase PAP2 family protein [Alistipes sp.]